MRNLAEKIKKRNNRTWFYKGIFIKAFLEWFWGRNFGFGARFLRFEDDFLVFGTEFCVLGTILGFRVLGPRFQFPNVDF